MTTAEQYRKVAADLRAKAAQAPTQDLALQWENLAKCHTRLSEQAEQNSFQDLWFEYGSRTREGEGEGA
jgi:hypothetical protein